MCHWPSCWPPRHLEITHLTTHWIFQATARLDSFDDFKIDVIINMWFYFMEMISLILNQFAYRSLASASSKTPFWRIRRLALCVALGISAGAAFAKTPVLNPAQLGTFCPPGSELADAKHTDILSVQEQAQIRKSVKGFMALDADVRRSLGHPLGPQTYWEKGYTEKFDVVKEVPDDWVLYISYRHSNTCVGKDRVLAIILLDIADISGRKIEKIFETPYSFVSPQSYWDAFSKAVIVLPEKKSTPEQPLLFTVLPLYKDSNNHWFLQQKQIPNLQKIIKAEWKEKIARINKYYRCDTPIQSSESACESNERKKQMLIRYSRPAWSIYPKDINLGIASHQLVKP